MTFIWANVSKKIQGAGNLDSPKRASMLMFSRKCKLLDFCNADRWKHASIGRSHLTRLKLCNQNLILHFLIEILNLSKLQIHLKKKTFTSFFPCHLIGLHRDLSEQGHSTPLLSSIRMIPRKHFRILAPNIFPLWIVSWFSNYCSNVTHLTQPSSLHEKKVNLLIFFFINWTVTFDCVYKMSSSY